MQGRHSVARTGNADDRGRATECRPCMTPERGNVDDLGAVVENRQKNMTENQINRMDFYSKEFSFDTEHGIIAK
jgi:BMFP domain-containing protein YqiC